jgi:hypothetical protein
MTRCAHAQSVVMGEGTKQGRPRHRWYRMTVVTKIRGQWMAHRFGGCHTTRRMATHTTTQHLRMIQRLDVLVPRCRRYPMTGFTDVRGTGMATRFACRYATRNMAAHTCSQHLVMIQWHNVLRPRGRRYPVTGFTEIRGTGMATGFA